MKYFAFSDVVRGTQQCVQCGSAAVRGIVKHGPHTAVVEEFGLQFTRMSITPLGVSVPSRRQWLHSEMQSMVSTESMMKSLARKST